MSLENGRHWSVFFCKIYELGKIRENRRKSNGNPTEIQ